MLFQVGGQGTRPTFFEMAAAQQLPASLRAALTYSLGVIRSPLFPFSSIPVRSFLFQLTPGFCKSRPSLPINLDLGLLLIAMFPF